MTEPTEPVTVDETTPVDPDSEAPSSRVGPRGDGIPEPLPGTDPMGSETGGLAGTSR
ncbi:hypothetical protein [Sphingomonas sp.]|jgi:hypothetical protein|uniref:hypothetical protein n=1 Tax=Sphingomonas sp. TaxID=28214 RepID=UPI002ED972FF